MRCEWERPDGNEPTASGRVNASRPEAGRLAIPPHSTQLLVYVLAARTTVFIGTMRSRHVR